MSIEIKLPKLYSWQVEALKSPKRHRLLVISRRAGKTELAKTIAVRALLAGQKVLWCAPIHQQTVEIFRSVKHTLGDLVNYKNTPYELQTITNGQMWFRSADNPDSLRSLGYDLVIFDEMAFADEAAWAVVRPTLAERKGEFVGISSPNGHNHFYDLYTQRSLDPDWYCVQRDWTCSPHLTPEEIGKAQREMLPSEFRQEFCAEFIQPKGAIFDASWLDGIMVEELPDVFQRTMIAVDLSLGKPKSDWQAIVFIGFLDGIAYVDCHAQRMPIAQLNEKVKAIWEQYKAEGIAFETNGFQQLAADNFLRLFVVPPPVYLIENRIVKETRIARLSTLLAARKIRILNNDGGKLLWNQLADFPVGDFDDCPDALEMAWRVLAESNNLS